MKKQRKQLFLLVGSVMLLFILLGANFLDSQVLGSNKAAICALTKIETEIGKNIEAKVEEQLKENQKSYIEKYALEEVAKPEKREDEEAMIKLAELAEEYELVKKIYEQKERFTMEMLHNLVNNPEMAAFVLGTLEANGETFGGFTEEELEEEYPLLLQFDPRWGYFTYGGKELAITGCGPTCLAMVVLSLTDEKDVTPDEIAAYSMDNGYYIKDVGTAWKIMDEYPTLYGLHVSKPLMKEEHMKAALDRGEMLICSVRKGVFTSEGHFIVIYGYDETGFKVNDPKCVARSRKTWKFEDFGKQLKQIWAIGV